MLKLNDIISITRPRTISFINVYGESYELECKENMFPELSELEKNSIVGEINFKSIICFLFNTQNSFLEDLKFKDEFLYDKKWYYVENHKKRNNSFENSFIPVREVIIKGGEKFLSDKSNYLFPLTKVEKITIDHNREIKNNYQRY